MTAQNFTLDRAASALTIRTRAKGLLARLAHDLEIAPTHFTGHATLEGDAWSGEILIPTANLEVVGVLKDGCLDRTVLSASDRSEIAKRMNTDVFRGAKEIRIEASGISLSKADCKVAIQSSECHITTPLTVHPDEARMRVEGSLQLSVRALGGREIKGPLGAFSVEDAIAISFALSFTK